LPRHLALWRSSTPTRSPRAAVGYVVDEFTEFATGQPITFALCVMHAADEAETAGQPLQCNWAS
jgi:hypothetical protein